MKAMMKMTIRTIRSFAGRYSALLFIIALSVGFFAGLKLTRDSMVHTGDLYLQEQQFYDYRLLSTAGFEEADVQACAKLAGIGQAEGSKTKDVLMSIKDKEGAYHLISLPSKLNRPSLKAGRLPKKQGECAVDARMFSKEAIGSTLEVAPDNAKETAAMLQGSEYKIVGLVDSPLYIGNDRGSTSIGGGSLSGFVYILEEEFLQEAYTEINLVLEENRELYSKAYDKLVQQHKNEVEKQCEQLAADRYGRLLEQYGLSREQAAQAGMEKPSVYVLTREENAGYVNFRNDTAIVSGIANVFPFFFIMIAMLVCMTTMTRMVAEERTQIGVLKALGYSGSMIAAKYILYAGSAAVIGWGAGYFLGTWGIPKSFWLVYNALYDFAPLTFVFSLPLAVATLAAALAGTLGSTWYCCRRELLSVPSELIRPAAPKKGKRILLERVPFLWSRMPFLQKVSLRNMFRYRQRLVMMLVGIGGCTALLLTGYGVRDSMLGINDKQYGGVQDYDMDVSFADGMGEDGCRLLEQEAQVEDYCSYAAGSIELVHGKKTGKARILSFQDEDAGSYFHMCCGETKLELPKGGSEVLVSSQVAGKLGIQAGDTIELRDADRATWQVTVREVFDNYIDNYVVMSAQPYEQMFESWQPQAAFVLASDPKGLAKALIQEPCISGVSRTEARKQAIEDILSCLKYVIWLVVFFAASLSFVVIYNLTNINLAERSREVATIKVLGFYPRETHSYILRENLILSGIAGVLGLFAGYWLHAFVMSRVDVDKLIFPVQIAPQSYVIAYVLTVVFAYLVNGYMKRRIRQIHMAESLKTVE